MNNLIFVGGIHGVGKGTFCKKVLSKTNSIHLSCSNLIKWTEISSIQNKKVKYILDGHFCLLNKENIISNVPFETFEKINPKGIIIISEEVEVIFKRLNLRDNLSYSIELLQGFQDREIARAKEVAKKLKVELFIFKNNFNEALNFIDKKL